MVPCLERPARDVALPRFHGCRGTGIDASKVGASHRPRDCRAASHPDFWEFGQSGRIWDVTSILEMLAVGEPAGPIRVWDLRPVRLAEEVILLSYTTEKDRQTTRRSSLWLRDSTRECRLRFHQGTATSDNDEGGAGS